MEAVVVADSCMAVQSMMKDVVPLLEALVQHIGPVARDLVVVL